MILSYAFHPVLVIAAIIPAVILLVQIYRADRLEKEPTGLLLSLLFLGILSTIPAVILELIGEFILDACVTQNQFLYSLIENFIIVGIAEEGSKYVLLRLRTWKHKAFDCQFDAIVYAVFVSLGFALFENIGYVISSGLGTALLRAVTAVPGHCCFGIFMGVFYGLAKRYQHMGKTEQMKRCRKLAVLIPVLIHGFYDFTAGSGSTFGLLLFIVFIVILFFLCFKLVRWMSQNDSYI